MFKLNLNRTYNLPHDRQIVIFFGKYINFLIVKSFKIISAILPTWKLEALKWPRRKNLWDRNKLLPVDLKRQSLWCISCKQIPYNCKMNNLLQIILISSQIKTFSYFINIHGRLSDKLVNSPPCDKNGRSINHSNNH